ncbi:MAG: hypothetical protein ACOYY3_20695 [Chloroflexota bacterium]
MSKEKSKKTDERELVTPDVVYQEMHEEMRRYRDYEITSSNWYTAILLAIAGVVLASKDNIELPLKLALTFLVPFLAISGIFTALYASSRYEHMRNWFDENLEPNWKTYKPLKKWLKPIHMIVAVQVVLGIFVIFMLWLND